MTNGQPAPPPPSKVNAKALETIVATVYPAMLGEPNAVRTRAQSAYTIASAISAALIAAGVVADIKDFAWPVQVLGVLAVGTWMLAAMLFIGISRRVTAIPRGDGQLLTESEFVAKSLQLAVDEASQLESRLQHAAWTVYAAVALTGAALLYALVDPPSDPAPVASRIVLTDEGAEAAAEVCSGLVGNTFEGKVVMGSLDDKFAEIEISPDECDGSERTLRIPPAQVRAVGAETD